MNPVVKWLRILLPIAFFAFIALIVASYSRGKIDRSGSIADEVDVAPREADDTPSLVMKTFEDTHSLGGKMISRIRATRTTGFKSGWYTLEGIDLTLFAEGGVHYTISAKQAQFNPETKEAEAVGGVKVTSSEGVELRTATLRFNGSSAANKVPVDFKVGAWEGRAGGIRLETSEEALHLTDGVKADLKTSDPAARASIEADEATSRQKIGQLIFSGNVRMTRQSESASADFISATTRPGDRALSALNGEGNIVIRLAGGSEFSAQVDDELIGRGETRITADRFVGDIPSGGVIRGLNFFGESMPVHAIVDGNPRRELTASQVRVEVTETRTISALRAEGKAIMSEAGKVPRAVEAEKIDVFFDPRTSKPSNAVLDKAVRFREPKSEGRADAATYDITGDRVVMSTVGTVTPTLTSEGTLLKASSIEIMPQAGILKGTGAVVVRYDSKKDSPTDSVLFSGKGQPVYVNAAAVHLTRQNRQATFTGGVKAWQDLNTLFSNELQIVENGEEMNARGEVRAILRQGVDESGAPRLVNARSDLLTANKAARQVEFNGNVRIEEPGRVVASDKTTMYFDAAQKLERIESAGNVIVTETATGRSAKGNQATYRVAQRTLRILGSPAVLTDPTGEVKGSEIRFDTASQKVEVIGGEAEYNPE
ncbi:MAG: LPS export ABC transporter periplasmic protein LptC [Acidobacteria bacterium]|nr:LPS export ABC transporter periplasmic protein LptC [Acidobacteriota bacterium]